MSGVVNRYPVFAISTFSQTHKKSIRTEVNTFRRHKFWIFYVSNRLWIQQRPYRNSELEIGKGKYLATIRSPHSSNHHFILKDSTPTLCLHADDFVTKCAQMDYIFACVYAHNEVVIRRPFDFDNIIRQLKPMQHCKPLSIINKKIFLSCNRNAISWMTKGSILVRNKFTKVHLNLKVAIF